MQLYQEFERKISQKEIEKLKIQIAKRKKLDKLPKNIYLNLDGKNIKTKPVRTQSGVAPVAIMTEPRNCTHGSCTFCPGGIDSYFGNVPKSYTGNEPASMRAIRNKFDAYFQVFNRLEHYVLLNQIPEKVELIIMGGTFLSYPREYRENFAKDAFKAMNDFGEMFFVNGGLNKNKFRKFFESDMDFRSKERTSKIHDKLLLLKKYNKLNRKSSLETEQLRNETAKIRCSVMNVETKPDWCFEKDINQMLRIGTTRVEIGVQTLYDKILKITNRGHTLEDTKKAIQLSKDSFLKTCMHMMIGLPQTTNDMDVGNFKKLFEDECYKPDALKIYPCMVMPGTPLYLQYKKGQFKPLSTEESAKLLLKIKPLIPKNTRVMRILRDIPTKVTTDGVGITNFRQYLHELMKKENIKCNCIRCREPRNKKINFDKVRLCRYDYKSSNGDETFLSYEDTSQDILLGFLRMRIPYKPFRPEITSKSAGIREIHVYGNLVPIGRENSKAIQHRGYGVKLMQKAEKIATGEFDIKKMLITSGIGARAYFYRLGYQRDGPYLSKHITKNR